MKMRKLMITLAFIVPVAGAVIANKKRDPLTIKVSGDPTCQHPVGPTPDGCSETGTNVCTVGLTIYYAESFCVDVLRRP